MKISTKGRYALIIMIELAKNYENGKFVSLKEIAEKEKLSLKYLEKIMLNLNKKDFLESSRGVDGGYRLKKEPKYYSIYEILKRAEGNLSVVSCLKKMECTSKNGHCITCSLWQELNGVIDNFLNSKTLEDYR